MGYYYHRLQKFKKARECYEKGIEIDPNDRIAHFALEWINSQDEFAKSTIEGIIKKSKKKRYMKKKYGCKFCAFYHQIDLPEKDLQQLFQKDLINKALELNELKTYVTKGISFFESGERLEDFQPHIEKLVTETVFKLNDIQDKLPSLCIYKNKIRVKPCYHFSLKVLDIDPRDRLEFHNSKINCEKVIFLFIYLFNNT